MQEAFLRFEISPPVSNAFPLTNQNSPEWNSALSFQEGFNRYQFENLSLYIPIENKHTCWKGCHNKIPIEV